MSIDPDDMVLQPDPPSHVEGVETVVPAPRKPVMATTHAMLQHETHNADIFGIGTSKIQVICSCGWRSNMGQINPVVDELSQHHRIIAADRASRNS
jgi:hypothetical protein